jgi:phosphopantothenoylcysteine decarboxylase/phosphopantothenate--cysteine ligase
VKFLITAGPTREPIDPVRYISNRSSGKMGYALAEAAIDSGNEVILVSGPVDIDPPAYAKLVEVTTADQMFDAVHRHLNNCDVCVMCAAVADYKAASVATQKIKKREAGATLELVRTPDILAFLGKMNTRRFLLVGFAAETDDLEQNALTKLRSKNCDIIVANDVSSTVSGMESAENEVTIFFRNGERRELKRALKKNIAHELIKIFCEEVRKMFDKKNMKIT